MLSARIMPFLCKLCKAVNRGSSYYVYLCLTNLTFCDVFLMLATKVELLVLSEEII